MHHCRCITLLAALVCLTIANIAAAQYDTRHFTMVLYPNDNANGPTDLHYFSLTGIQPAGLSIADFGDWRTTNWSAVVAKNYDWSRIVAVVIDEPYWNALWAGTMADSLPNPCLSPSSQRCQQLQSARAQLANIGDAIHSASSTTVFWVNFSDPEVQWMGYGGNNGNVALFDDWADVISVDKYGVDFSDVVEPMCTYLANHRTKPSQQLALVPATFVLTSGGAGGAEVPAHEEASVAERLSEFFAYANTQNASCAPVTGTSRQTFNYAGCLVRFVAGYAGTGSRMGSDGNFAHFLLDDPTPSRTDAVLNQWARQFQLSIQTQGTPPSTAASASVAATLYL